MKIEAIDLFCGIGGLTHGLQKAKINVLAGLDNDETCKYSYEKNNNSKFIGADIKQYDFHKMINIFSKNSFRVLVGCAPCQPFSTHTTKIKNKKTDARWNLIEYFLKAIKILNPHIISMENVRGFIKTDIFNKFKKVIKKLGYQINYDLVFCPDYGIPQSRTRLIFLASKIGEIELPKKTHEKKNYVTVKKTIGSLPCIKAGEFSNEDKAHKAKNLSPLNIKRIISSKQMGTWKDWNKKLLPKCYLKKTGQTYTSVYGRMSWNRTSPTITTQFFNYGSGRFGHPEQNRALSLREGALLQTFPLKYDFGKKIHITKIARHIGNAVPPHLGFIIGKVIYKHVENYSRYAE